MLRTVQLFLAGGLVTAIFSGSLVTLTRDIALAEVLCVGLIVPSFTWVVQLTASGILLPPATRFLYWRALGLVCLLGSVALLPAAAVNLAVAHPAKWISLVNVLASVIIMAGALFRLCVAQQISWRWPVSWCLTIGLNMALFAWTSRHWWA